tara:strand:+ start:15039 stop:15575 length:537 start_codon:yes stop_codon:yes gene_type:complete
MNKGIGLAKGKWLYFLGSDDKIYKEVTLKEIFEQKIEGQTKLLLGKIKYNFKETDSFFLKKNKGIVISSWSQKIWFKNTLHHQAIFYHRDLFINLKYLLRYNILADYALNLTLYKKGVEVQLLNKIIAVCDTNGLSKNYTWQLYKEEIHLKTTLSTILLKPFFYVLVLIKFIVKKLNY